MTKSNGGLTCKGADLTRFLFLPDITRAYANDDDEIDFEDDDSEDEGSVDLSGKFFLDSIFARFNYGHIVVTVSVLTFFIIFFYSFSFR